MLVIKFNENITNEDNDNIKSFFTQLYNKIDFSFYKKYLVIKYEDIVDFKIEELVENIIEELLLKINVYSFKNIPSDFDIDYFLELIESYTPRKNINFINEQTLFQQYILPSTNIKIKEYLKQKITDLEMINIIKVFIESNLNTTKAAEKLYMHRNTLINKLDKFKEETGYDLRNFLDSYVIYSIIE